MARGYDKFTRDLVKRTNAEFRENMRNITEAQLRFRNTIDPKSYSDNPLGKTAVATFWTIESIWGGRDYARLLELITSVARKNLRFRRKDPRTLILLDTYRISLLNAICGANICAVELNVSGVEENDTEAQCYNCLNEGFKVCQAAAASINEDALELFVNGVEEVMYGWGRTFLEYYTWVDGQECDGTDPLVPSFLNFVLEFINTMGGSSAIGVPSITIEEAGKMQQVVDLAGESRVYLERHFKYLCELLRENGGSY